VDKAPERNYPGYAGISGQPDRNCKKAEYKAADSETILVIAGTSKNK